MQAEVAQGQRKLFVQSHTELISEPRLEQRHSNSQALSQTVVIILLPKLYSQRRSEMIIRSSAECACGGFLCSNNQIKINNESGKENPETKNVS